MRGAVWLLLVVPAVFLPFTGCTSCVSGPPVSARGIGSGPAEAGVGGFALDVLVTDGPGGPPLQGAGVVVYWAGDAPSEWSGPRVDASDDRVVVEPMNRTSSVEAKKTHRLFTGADGTARAHVDGNRILGVVAAKDGFTEEWFPAVAGGSSGASGRLKVPLYRERIVADVDAVWGPGGASSGTVTGNNYLWDPHPAPFGKDEDDARGYAARIAEMIVRVSWDNGPTSSGDLAIGAGPPATQPSYFKDGAQNVGAGAQAETATLTVEDLARAGIVGAPAVRVGAASDSAFVAPFGLPYKMHVEARFDTSRAAFGACNTPRDQDNNTPGASVPGAGVAAAVAGVAVAALAARRKFR